MNIALTNRTAAGYESLNDEELKDNTDKSVFPTASIRVCKAPGGKEKPRVCFDLLNDNRFYVACLRDRPNCFQKWTFAPLSVTIDGVETTVFLNVNSLIKRLGFSERVCLRMIQQNDLAQIIQTRAALEQLRQNPEIVPKVTQDLDIRTETFFGYIGKNGLIARNPKRIGRGLSATVFSVETPQGPMAARECRICSDEQRERVERMIRAMTLLKETPGVLSLAGVMRFPNEIITFHPLIKQTLQDVLESYKPLSEELRISYAKQLFDILSSINGSHGDIKPNNILIEDNKIVLCDWEDYSSEPEVNSSKVDVLLLGLTLYYLFSAPQHVCFRLEKPINPVLVQKQFDERIDIAPLAAPIKGLLRKMMILDIAERCTIQEARGRFFQCISEDGASIWNGEMPKRLETLHVELGPQVITGGFQCYHPLRKRIAFNGFGMS